MAIHFIHVKAIFSFFNVVLHRSSFFISIHDILGGSGFEISYKKGVMKEQFTCRSYGLDNYLSRF